MADKIVIEAEVKSNIGKQVKETEDWGKSIKDVSGDLDFQKKMLIEMEKDLIKLEKQQAKMSDWENSINRTTARIKEQKLEIKMQKNDVKAMTHEQKMAIKIEKEATAEKKKSTKEKKEGTAATKEATEAQKKQDKAVKEGIGSFTLFGVSLNGIKKGFKNIIPTAKAMFGSIKAGLLATGIGAFIVLIGSLMSYFKSSKKGADTLKVAMAGIGAAVRVVTDVFAKVGETIVNAFNNPKQAISDLWEAIKKNLINRLTGMVDAFKGAMKIIGAAIKLDWEGVTEGAKDFGKALVQVGTGLDEQQQKKFAQGIKNVVAEIKEEVKVMTDLERASHRLRDAENEFLVTKAKTRLAVAQAKLDSKDETKSLEERKAALQSALDMQQATTDKEIALARQKMAIQQQQMATSTNMAEDEEKLAQLKADVFSKEAASLLQQKRLKQEMNAFDKQIADEKQAIIDAQNEADEKQRLKDEEALLKKQEEAEILLALQQENSLALIEDLRERALAELQIQEDKALAEAELMENSEEMKAAIEEKYARKRGEIDKKFSKDKAKWSEMTSKQQLDIASNTAGSLAKILGEETAAGKAMAITQATIDTYKGATAAYASLAGIPVVGPVLGGIAAAAAVAAGIANVKAITSASSTGPSGGGGGGITAPDTSAPAPQMMSGAFDLEGGIEPEPTRAYVVTDEMTNSQDQLANIRRRATI